MRKIIVAIFSTTLLFSVGVNLNLDSITSSALNNFKSSTTSYLTGYNKNLINSFNNKIFGDKFNAGILSFCYEYKPKPIRKLNFNFNICSVLANQNICKVAPDLSAFGYVKRTNTIHIKDYCENIFGYNNKDRENITPEFAKENINYTDIIYTDINNDTTLAQQAEDLYNDNSPLSYKNALRKKEMNKNDAVVARAIETNDYESMKAFEMAYKNSEGKISKDDAMTDINVPYNTIEDYEKSVESFKNNLDMLNEQLSLEKLSKYAVEAFSKINSETEDREERIKQKKAQMQSMLDEYKKIVDKWVKLEIDTKLVTQYKPYIVYPIKDLVKGYSKDNRAKVVFNIEKQKMEKALLMSNIEKQGLELKDKAYVVLSNELVRSMEFDSKSAMEEINSIIGD